MTYDTTSGGTDSSKRTLQPDLRSLASILSQDKLLPVLRAKSASVLQSMVDMCLEAESKIIELTTTSPGWEEVLAGLQGARDSSGVIVGVGTVVSERLAHTAVSAGADFLVTPYRVEELSAVPGPVPVIRGAFSPSELAAAREDGEVIKLFPASPLGPAYLRAVLEVLPGTMVVPTGGLTTDSARAWLDAGAVAVGMGSRLFDAGAAGIRALRLVLAG